MCHPLSLCVTEDHRVLAAPGVHSHSRLVRRAFGDDPNAAVYQQRGVNMVGVEVNLLHRKVVLDERTLPRWYNHDHDEALFGWIDDNLGSKALYRDHYAPRELAAMMNNGKRHPSDVDLVVAPFGVTEDAVAERFDEVVFGTAPEATVEGAKDVVARLLDDGPGWSPPWSEEREWEPTFDNAIARTESRVVGAPRMSRKLMLTTGTMTGKIRVQ